MPLLVKENYNLLYYKLDMHKLKINDDHRMHEINVNKKMCQNNSWNAQVGSLIIFFCVYLMCAIILDHENCHYSSSNSKVEHPRNSKLGFNPKF